MAGRRRPTRALATAADTASELIFANQQHDRELRDRANELVAKFQLDSQLEKMRFIHEAQLKGYAVDSTTGTVTRPTVPSAVDLPPGATYERDVPGGRLTLKGPVTKPESDLQRIQEYERSSAIARNRMGAIPSLFGGPSPEAIDRTRLEALRSTGGSSAVSDPIFTSRLQKAKAAIASGKDPLAIRNGLIRFHPDRASEIDLELQTPALAPAAVSSESPQFIDEQTGRPVRKLPNGQWVYADR